MTDRDSESGSRSAGPVGTLLGATIDSFGAAVGNVVDENRFAFGLAVGSGGSNGDDGTGGSLDDAATIEIEDTDASAYGTETNGTDDAVHGDESTTESELETDDAPE